MEVPETDWNREDWMPVFEPFDEQEGLNYDGAFGSARARLGRDIEALVDEPLPEDMDEEDVIEELNRGTDYPEGEIFYSTEGVEDEIFMHYAPPNEDGIVAGGTLSLDLDFVGEGPVSAWEDMVEKHGTDYLSAPRESHPDSVVARVNIPEDYDEEVLEDTAEALVKISRNVAELDSELGEVAGNYEFNYLL